VRQSSPSWFVPLLLALAVPLAAQVQPATSPGLAALPPLRGTVHVDRPGDGLVWAKGDDWKASFGPAGVVFVPFLGADAPRNFPLALQLVRVTSGARELAFAAAGATTPRGTHRLEIERGCTVEAYELRPGGIEQMFVFADAPRDGALAVELAITTELGGEASPDGACRFRNEFGGVDVGKATAIDAAGRATPCLWTFTPQRVRWTVPADFVATATFPLTIDPVISTAGLLPAQVAPLLAPDVAFVGSWGGYYGAVIEEVFSATDHDVVIVARDPDGNLGDVEYVDLTGTSWIRSKVASHRAASQFLCVAQRVGPTAFGIAARRVDPSALGGFPTLSPLSQLPVTTTIFEARPDVGGDASILATLPGDYCITWEANGSVDYRRLDTTGTFGLVQTIPTTLPASHARIAKSCGTNLAAVAEWTIVYEQEVNANDHDAWGMRLSRTGVAGAPFPIATGPTDDRHAEVSAKADLIAGEPWMVVWDRFVPGGPFTVAHFDIHGAVYSQDSAITPATDLTSLLLRTTSFDQTNPCVDTDGIRFAVGFAERPQVVANVQPYLARRSHPELRRPGVDLLFGTAGAAQAAGQQDAAAAARGRRLGGIAGRLFGRDPFAGAGMHGPVVRQHGVAAPFGDVAVHVVQPERVGAERTDRRGPGVAVVGAGVVRPARHVVVAGGSVGEVAAGEQVLDGGTGRPWRRGAGSARILPLGFGRQGVAEPLRQRGTALPAHVGHRVAFVDLALAVDRAGPRLAGAIAHRGGPMRLLHLELGQEERRQLHPVRRTFDRPGLRVVVRAVLVLALGAHGERATWQQHEDQRRRRVALQVAAGVARGDRS